MGLWSKLTGLLTAQTSRPSGPSRMQVHERTSTHTACLIIGGGHNGLSVAAGLKSRGIDPIVLEQHPAIGDQWRNRYERLHLHHVTDAMHQPGVPYPKHVPRYLSRLDLADYLDSYAHINNLDVRINHRVQHLCQNTSGQWVATVERPGDPSSIEITADEVVLAVGVKGVTPRFPELEGRDQWSGRVLHSMEYHNAEGFEGQRVLIVGAGNSGVEICCDLYDHGAKPSILIRSPGGFVTREAFSAYQRLLPIGGFILKYVPFSWILAPVVIAALDQYFLYDVRRRYGDLSSKGVTQDSPPPMRRMLTTRGEKAPTYVDGTWGDVGVSIFDLIRDDEVPTFGAEISRLVPGSKTVVFKDGKTAEFDAIVLCTGFLSILAHYATFVDKALHEKMKKGFRVWEEVDGIPGLWCSLGSLAGSRYAAQILAERVAAKIQKRRPPARILSGPWAYHLVGIDPGLVQIPKRTILINAVAGLGLLGYLAGFF